MDDLFRSSVKLTEDAKKPLESVSWKPDEPFAQDVYGFDLVVEKWIPVPLAASTGVEKDDDGDDIDEKDVRTRSINRLALYSWNIDFMLPFPKERMEAALAYLQDLTSVHFLSSSSSDESRLSAHRDDNEGVDTTGVVMFLQECVSSDLQTICSRPWIRERFLVTDINTENWANGHYGTVTLIDRRFLSPSQSPRTEEKRGASSVVSCFRVHYSKTRMDRDVLVVDIALPSPSSSGNKNFTTNDEEETKDKKNIIIRFCNTHLESLALEPPYRPPQMALTARLMQETATIDGALAAGDFNAIQPFDRTLHADNGLRDAFLELGGQEDDEAGYTWGQQAATTLRERFGCSRMDKVYLTKQRPGNEGAKELLKLERFDRFGADVLIPEEGDDGAEAKTKREKVEALGFEKPWITDHMGVMVEVRLDV